MNYVKRFQKLIGLLFIATIIYTSEICAASGNGDLIVHVTKTGACYHKSGCGALKSDIEITLEEAYVNGYQRCDRCNPPEYTGELTRGYEKQKSEGGNGGSSTSKKSASSSTYVRSAAVSNDVAPDYLNYIIVGIVGLCTVGGGSYLGYKSIKASKEKKMIEEQKRQEKEQRRLYYEKYCKGREVHEIVNAPEAIIITKKGEIFDQTGTTEKPFGDRTIYVTISGKKYHSKRRHGDNYFERIGHEYVAISHGYSPCKICYSSYYEVELPEWFKEIPKVVNTIREFEGGSEA